MNDRATDKALEIIEEEWNSLQYHIAQTKDKPNSVALERVHYWVTRNDITDPSPEDFASVLKSIGSDLCLKLCHGRDFEDIVYQNGNYYREFWGNTTKSSEKKVVDRIDMATRKKFVHRENKSIPGEVVDND